MGFAHHIVVAAMLTCSTQSRHHPSPCASFAHEAAIFGCLTATSSGTCHPPQTGTAALQAMPFLATLTIALVVSTIASVLSTVQATTPHAEPGCQTGDPHQLRRRDCLQCGTGCADADVHRKMEAALQSDSRRDHLKDSGKVR